ncbi:MAG: response regulator [Gallionella sp.]
MNSPLDIDTDPALISGSNPNRRSTENGTHVIQPEAFPQALAAVHEEPINILVVDDEPKNLTVLETVLDNPGYRLVRAASADEALLALVAEEFALLILDIQMPGMNGFELAEMIKQRKKTAQVPIIFLTAFYNQDQDMLAGYGTGAVDYLHKPVNASVLRSKVAVFAELHKKNREYEVVNRALLTEVTERRRAQDQLRELNETLEQRVTERTEALLRTSAALNESLERYRSLFNGSLDAIISLDTTGRFLAANPAMLRLSGRPLAELKNLSLQELCPPDQQERMKKAFPAAFDPHGITIETILITASGEPRDVFISGAPMMMGDKVVGVSCIARDVTERNRAEAEVKNALAVAEQASRAKSDFLSSMSHELRTPLNAILGFAQLLMTGSPSPSPVQISRINEIVKAGWYLLELIDEILDLAAIEAGKLSVSREPVMLSEVMLECQTMIEPEAQKDDIRINFLPVDDSWVINADRTRVKQTLLNLLSNSIKYNRKQGTVEVKCTGTPERIRISVKDSGVGLSEENQARLFQPFNRLGQETGGQQGTGIGLVVTKQLIEMMGGSIGVESALGVGSEFWIDLPRYAIPYVDSAPQRAAENNALPGGDSLHQSPSQDQEREAGHILLYVEDNPANLTLVEQMIESCQNICMMNARDGNQGIALARTHLPDVILMDINLPDISGFEVMEKLREDAATADIPIIALSAHALPGDIAKGHEAGFFRYLTKPIKADEFMDALTEALKFSETSQSDDKPTRMKNSTQRQVNASQ